jgi:flagellar assembly protein FliH
MMRRLDTAGSEVLPWRVPQLNAPEEAPSGPEAVPRRDEPAELPPAEDLVPVAAEPPALGEIIEREAARGYADGVERGLAEGREQGYADGYAHGAEAAKEALAHDAQRLAAIVAELRSPIRALDQLVEEALLALALEVARCVIGHETSLSRVYLVRLIRETLAAVPVPMSGLRVQLNPQDLELIRSLAPELEAGGALLHADPAVDAGGCRVVVDDEPRIKERRWQERHDGAAQIDLSLAARWRGAMVSLFEGDGR